MSIRRGEKLDDLSDSSKYYIMSDPVIELNGSDKFGYVPLQGETFFLFINRANSSNINLDEIWMASEDARTKIPIHSLIWDNEKKELRPFVFSVFKGERLSNLQLKDFFGNDTIQYFILSNGALMPQSAVFGELPLTTNDDRLFIIANVPLNQSLHNLDLPPNSSMD